MGTSRSSRDVGKQRWSLLITTAAVVVATVVVFSIGRSVGHSTPVSLEARGAMLLAADDVSSTERAPLNVARIRNVPPSEMYSSPSGLDSKQLRVMFVGDSITEGMAPSHSNTLRPLVPKEGSCSYRFPLMQALERRGITALPVGPFSGHVGTQRSPLLCQQQLQHYIPGVSEQHAAIWGITAKELLGPTSLQKKRQFARRYYFGKRAKITAEADATIGRVKPSDRAGVDTSAIVDHSHLRRWADVLQPRLITVLIGTNDLSQGAQVEDVVIGLLPSTILALLFPRVAHPRREVFKAASEEAEVPLTCTRRVAVATLLPRSMPMQLMVGDVNKWIGRINMCKVSSALDLPACMECVAKEATPTSVYGSELNGDGNLLLKDALRSRPVNVQKQRGAVEHSAFAWCLPCVYILNISDSKQINDSTDFMYDGLHPNEAGEQRIGTMMAEALERSGALL